LKRAPRSRRRDEGRSFFTETVAEDESFESPGVAACMPGSTCSKVAKTVAGGSRRDAPSR
jgi:hypothetical protein